MSGGTPQGPLTAEVIGLAGMRRCDGRGGKRRRAACGQQQRSPTPRRPRPLSPRRGCRRRNGPLVTSGEQSRARGREPQDRSAYVEATIGAGLARDCGDGQLMMHCSALLLERSDRCGQAGIPVRGATHRRRARRGQGVGGRRVADTQTGCCWNIRWSRCLIGRCSGCAHSGAVRP
jgi:hypothetical protein